jgi:hypothetical protein
MGKSPLHTCTPQFKSQSKGFAAQPGRVETLTNAGHALFIDDGRSLRWVLAEFMDLLAVFVGED